MRYSEVSINLVIFRPLGLQYLLAEHIVVKKVTHI